MKHFYVQDAKMLDIVEKNVKNPIEKLIKKFVTKNKKKLKQYNKKKKFQILIPNSKNYHLNLQKNN